MFNNGSEAEHETLLTGKVNEGTEKQSFLLMLHC